MDQRVDLPVAEVAGEQEHTSIQRVGRDDAVGSLELHARHHLLAGQRAELQEHGQEPAEVGEHVAGDRRTLPRRAERKRRLQIAQGQLSMTPIDGVKNRARAQCRQGGPQTSATAASSRERWRRRRTGVDGGSSGDRSLPRLACLTDRAGQPVVEGGPRLDRRDQRHPIRGRGKGRNGNSRTRSFSVVTTTAAECCRAVRNRRSTSPAE